MLTGLILKGIGGFYYIKHQDRIYECKARGIFRNKGISPLPGDRVEITVTDEEKLIGVIETILQRDNENIRPPVANVDQVAVVISINAPKVDKLLLDKLLVTAETKNIEAVIFINKMDLDKDKEFEKIVKDYENTGYKILRLNALNDEGFNNMDEVLKGRTTVFAGQSGVGKSTILNTIMKTYVMPTGTISKGNSRGKHTTRHVELIALKNGGYVVDTPGFSSYEIDKLSHEELHNYFPEFKDYLFSCKFTGCSHISEPKCSVKKALENGLISENRYNFYCDVYKELHDIYKNRYSK